MRAAASNAKVSSMTDTRVQDRVDAQHLLQFTPGLEISRVREHLTRTTDRGYAREQDLEAKVAVVLNDVGHLKRQGRNAR